MTDTVATTDRLILREWRDADKRAFYDVMNTPAVMKNLGGVQDWDTWSAAHDRITGFTRDFGHTFWIVEDKKSGELIGFCGLKRVNSPGAGDLTGTPKSGGGFARAPGGKASPRKRPSPVLISRSANSAMTK